jgi:hypothetical protein
MTVQLHGQAVRSLNLIIFIDLAANQAKKEVKSCFLCETMEIELRTSELRTDRL